MPGETPNTAEFESEAGYTSRLHEQLSDILAATSYQKDAYKATLVVGNTTIVVTDQLFGGEHHQAPALHDRDAIQQAHHAALQGKSAIIGISSLDNADYEGMPACIIFRPSTIRSDSLVLGAIVRTSAISEPDNLIIWSPKQGVITEPWQYPLIRDAMTASQPGPRQG